MDSLADQIVNALADYSEEIEEKIDTAVDEIAEKAVQSLKNNPNIPVNKGKYKKGFYSKIIAKGEGYKRVAVANRRYQLTHLLEKGHAIHNGTSRARAFPHWEDAQKLVEKEVERVTGEL